MNELFNGSSASQRGTLYHIKHWFGHRPVKKHVTENVPHVYDFVTDIICLAAPQKTFRGRVIKSGVKFAEYVCD